jgi:2-polyprenyl-3-methyl-5-hydroxy-6-metoxy-1,4-benzoquinol methylase
MSEQIMDQSKSEAFARKMVGILNNASLALMTSIGHQTGLFDVLASLPPATSGGIAGASGLNERYVREWLGAMTVGGIIDYDAASKTFRLPPEHAAWLTRSAGVNNLATRMQSIPLLASVEPGIIASFARGGGVPYAEYPAFQKIMAEGSAMRQDTLLISTILPLVPDLVGRLEGGIEVLDIGCGQGHAANLMAQAYPRSRFRGYDFSAQGIDTARQEADALKLTNVQFAVQDLALLHEPDKYSLITAFDVIHDQAKPTKVLESVFRALTPDGIFLMVDIRASSDVNENMGHPLGPFLYTISTMHCMTVSLALDGEGLGTVWGEQRALEMLAAAGFTSVQVRQIEGDILNNYYICRK